MTAPTPQEIEVKLSEFCLIEYSAYLKERERNERLVKALEFYSDPDNWSFSSSQVCPAMINGDDIRKYEAGKNLFVGGKVASEALEAEKVGVE